MRWPRLFPPTPFTALPTPDGHAWCTGRLCGQWRPFDVIAPIYNAGVEVVPALTICGFCGCWIAEFDLEESA